MLPRLQRWLSTLILSAALWLMTLPAAAQTEIGVRVQVNRLPQGTYPTKLYQFNNMPGLVVVTLTNRTQSAFTLYLNGQLTGDNGVSITTARGYQPGTIELKPLEVKTLNAIEAGNLFDPNYLVYQAGNNSIRASVFGEQGLPEGTYQVCVRAFNVSTQKALSEEDPMGCSNVFTVRTLEPPMILNPYDDANIPYVPAQNIPLRWTTPPGAPPNTEYQVRIVEVPGGKNPNDAMQSTPVPFFETTITGAPLLLYSMQYPLLQEGHKYAIRVTANDPLGGATFRNLGRSEVIQFTYRNMTETEIAQLPVLPEPAEYANKTLIGRLMYTFKKSEQASHSLYIQGSGVDPRMTTTEAGGVARGLDVTSTPDKSSLFLTAGMGVTATGSIVAGPLNSGLVQQAAVTPLISMNALGAMTVDPTLIKTDVGANKYGSQFSDITGPILPTIPASTFTASGATSTESSYVYAAFDSASERYPLANVYFTLSAQTATGNKLLATGKTDQEGNFAIQYLDPSYGNSTQVKQLVLSVQSADFENTAFSIPASILSSDATDIGKFLLIAKTFRFYTKCNYPKVDDNSGTQGYGVHVYREISDIDVRPWLLNEGQTPGTKKNIITVDGLRVVEIAADTFSNSVGRDLGVLTTISTLDTRGAGRIFYGGRLYVKIIPQSDSYFPISSAISVANYSVASTQVLNAKAIYDLRVRPASIRGKVSLALHEQEGVPVKGATVRVLIKKADVIKSDSPFGNLWESPTDVASSANTYISTYNNYTTTNPAITSFQAVQQSAATTALTPALLVGSGSNGKFVAQPALGSVPFQPFNDVPDDMRAITTTTDELGNYNIGLPELKPSSSATVQVINVPREFITFTIKDNPQSTTIGKGISKVVNFKVDADVAYVVGRVVDADGKSLVNVRLNFAGKTMTETGPDGLFHFRIYPGDHTISLEKEGYVIKTTVIHVPQLTGNTGDRNRYESEWINMTVLQKQTATLNKVQTTPTVQASIARGNTFDAAMFGIATGVTGGLSPVTEYNMALAIAFNSAAADKNAPQYEIPREFAIDVRDIGYLVKITGKIRFRIVDEATNQPIPNTKISLFDTSNVTDPAGEWFYEGFGGACTITLAPPSSSGYASEQKTYVLAETGVETILTIGLKKGVQVSGKVSSGGSPLSGARILVDDNDFMSITTDAQGNYTFFTTATEHTVAARKQNYVGEDKTQTIPASGATIDFNLKGGNGRNYGTLLGFAVELSSTTTVTATQEKWSGAFVNLNPVSGIFGIPANQRIPFTDVVVNFSGANGTPQNNEVRTDVDKLSFKLFGYLPAKLLGTNMVTFTKAADASGQLSGKIKVDFGSINGYRGWSMDDITALLAKTGSASPDDIVVFSSGAAPAVSNSYTMIPASGSISGKLYGFSFTVNNNALIDNDGVEISGLLSTPSLGVIKPINIGLQRLFINRALVIGAVQVQTDNLPTLEISSWKAALSSLGFSEDGFKIGGSISVTLPQSGTSQISFSDLSIAKDGIFGGSFTIPGAGINVLNVANLSTDGAPLSFGRVGNSSVYRIGGKAALQINVGIFSKSFKVPLFEILTNGEFNVEVPVNYSTNLGPFGFTVNDLFINTIGSPYIGVKGSIKADFDVVKFELADIKVRASASGPTFSVEKLGVKLDVPVVKTEAYVTFKDDGFEGDGSLSIPGTPIAGTIGFKYYKHSNGVTELGAHFFTNIPPIPIGVLVTLDGVGGGFEYVSGGPNGGFKVDVNCALSFLGTGPAVRLKPLGLTVSSAGILKGYGDVEIASYFTTGHAEVEFNGPERTFTVRINVNMSPLEGLTKQTVTGILAISAKPNDEYAFLGASTHIEMLGLIDDYGEMGIGIRVKNAKTRGGEISKFFEHAPDEYIGDVFSGVYIDVGAKLGIPENDPWKFDLYVVSGELFCYTQFTAGLLLNLENQSFRIRFGGKFSAGVKGCVGLVCAYADASLCYMVEGGRSASLGWNFSATATGTVSLGIGGGIGGCDPDCNEVAGPWSACAGVAFNICGTASIDFGFAEKGGGVRFSVRAGGNLTNCFW